jgi:serine/threonine-protein kinase
MRPRGPPPEALVGTELFGGYRVIQHLGSGGMAHVYLAEHHGPDEARGDRVALKVLRSEHAPLPALVARFEREAIAAARIAHPNVLEVGPIEHSADGVPFFRMELLVGLDLADTLAFARLLAPERASRVALGIARALAAAHSAGVVHRDVKPENIFLVHASDGRELVKLLDFGFAWLQLDTASAAGKPITRGVTVVGTPEYMAPEQAQGARAAPTTDIYSFGIVLFEMLTGSVPFTGEYPRIADRHAEEAVPALEHVCPGLVVSGSLRALVFRALAKDPQARFVDGGALVEALEATAEVHAGRR